MKRIFATIEWIDYKLLAVPSWVKIALFTVTALSVLFSSIIETPKELYHISNIQQHSTFISQSLADRYEAKVILNNIGDMYTKDDLKQTRSEKKWTKDEAAPYPPATLLMFSAIFWIGEKTGITFPGISTILAYLFIILSAIYFYQTKWYLFPFIYLYAPFLGRRFFYSQNTSYLLLILMILFALILARLRKKDSPFLMGLAIIMKLSPIFYLKNIFKMRTSAIATILTLLVIGLILPYFIWDNYLYIYNFQETKGDRIDPTLPLIIAGIFSLILWYVEVRMQFDAEERIGWSAVPFGLFFMLKMNIFRHLIFMLLIPDKRGWRSMIGGICLLLSPFLMEYRVFYFWNIQIATFLLFIAMGYYLTKIGWETLQFDITHPIHTLKDLLFLPFPKER